jgi:hypothetical protein
MSLPSLAASSMAFLMRMVRVVSFVVEVVGASGLAAGAVLGGRLPLLRRLVLGLEAGAGG